MKDLNVRTETVKHLEENTEGKLPDICLGNNFLNMTSKAQVTRAKIDKWDYIKLKVSAQHRKQSRIKRQAMEWQKISTTLYLIRNEYIRNFYNLVKKKERKKEFNFKMGRELRLGQTFFKEEI